MDDQDWEALFDTYITEVVDDEQEHIKSHMLPTAIKIRSLVSDSATQAAANKAAEEGGLPFAELSINQKRALSEGLSALEAMADIWSAEIRLSEMAQRIADAPAEQRPGTIAAMIEQAFIEGAYRHFLDHKDAADRASRQVANKAEVDLSSLKRYYRSDTGMEHTRKSGGWVKFKDVRELLATPPATTGGANATPTGASTAPRPTDDELWDATLRDRDAYQEWADKLADAIAKHFGVDIGEHSNQNLPWAEALEAIENAETVGASTVLTDERIEKIWQQQLLDAPGGKLNLYFGRAVAREVAAQAGQVAMPEWISVDEQLPSSDLLPNGDCPSIIGLWKEGVLASNLVQQMITNTAYLRNNPQNFTHWMPLPPSPAKESK